MVASGERQLRILVIHGRFGSGFHIAMIPADLRPEEIRAALQELGIDGAQAFELGGWRTSSQHVAVAHVPFPATD